jgi:hypothetical protein
MGSGNIEPRLLNLLKDLEEYVVTSRRKGIFRARIEKLDTAEADRNGRCRVRIFGEHSDDMPVDTLPWAEHRETDGGGADYGDHTPLAIGDIVLVQYEDGNPDYPVITGIWRARLEGDESEIPAECRNTDASYEKRRIFKTRGGHRIEMSDDPDNLEIVIRTGLYSDPDYPQPSDGENVGERRITIRDSDDFGIQICTPQGFIRMNDQEKKMQIFWDGDWEEHITGSKSVTVDGGYNLTIGGAWTVVVAIASTITSPFWTWLGNLHTRQGKTFDKGPNDHGP